MKVAVFHISAVVFCLSCLSTTSANDDFRLNDGLPEFDPELGKRLYDFGLGKRVYHYGNDFKRRPMYDFGLGKRAKTYSFGLGKRAEDEELDNYMDDEEHIPETEIYDDDDMQEVVDKRAQKSYSFGLGKRPRLYEFGLGKRARQYDFGLGKRERQYSFGLGKRGKQMYSFGLGKRSADYNVDKREVAANELKAVLNDNENSTTPVESHEGMGHGEKVLSKRSPRQYAFGLGKREDDEPSFPRQYRKPSYSFGLGKRRQMYNFGLGKRSESP